MHAIQLEVGDWICSLVAGQVVGLCTNRDVVQHSVQASSNGISKLRFSHRL